MAWVYLWLAGCAEIVFAVSLKYSEGFRHFWPSALTIVAGASSLALLTVALKTLPVGTAYAVWTGMGAAGVALLGMVLFKESTDWPRIVSLLLVIIGVIGLQYVE